MGRLGADAVQVNHRAEKKKKKKKCCSFACKKAEGS